MLCFHDFLTLSQKRESWIEASQKLEANSRETLFNGKALIQLGCLARNKLSPQSQFALTLDQKNRATFFVGGFLDNSFRIINEELEAFEVSFHKKSVSCIQFMEEDDLIVCGSRDSRVSFWSKTECMTNGRKPKPLFVSHAHYDEVVCMDSNSTLGLVASSDKANYICISDILKFRILTSFSLNFGVESASGIIARMELSEAGYLLAGSSTNYCLCSLSGEVIKCFEANFVRFMDPFALKLVKPLDCFKIMPLKEIDGIPVPVSHECLWS